MFGVFFVYPEHGADIPGRVSGDLRVPSKLFIQWNDIWGGDDVVTRHVHSLSVSGRSRHTGQVLLCSDSVLIWNPPSNSFTVMHSCI